MMNAGRKILKLLAFSILTLLLVGPLTAADYDLEKKVRKFS